jgi:predicted Zn-ribbon and HTH transcriptional regulator
MDIVVDVVSLNGYTAGMATTIELPICHCERCGYDWTPKNRVVNRCANPKCRSPYWDRPRGMGKIKQTEIPLKRPKKGWGKKRKEKS